MSEARKIGMLSLVIDDYDRAIAFFTEALGFVVLEDTRLSDAKRWVRVAPSAAAAFQLLLARAATEAQARAIGDQAGGRVFLFLETDDFARDYAAMRAKGVVFEEAPRQEPYGVVAVFRDLWGNRWDLIEYAA